MLSRRSVYGRIPLIRPLRPPNLQSTTTKPRPFTQKSRLLLVARHTSRPQLPYLSQSSFTRRLSPLDQQVLRLLSTETRTYVKEQFWLATKWTAIIWTFLGLGAITFLGIQIEADERANPTPDEWSFWTRQALRTARSVQDGRGMNGVINWGKIQKQYNYMLARLEDPNTKDGRGVAAQDSGEGILIPEVGKAGLDISAKSWQWRAGYFEALMGAARVAEQLEDYVLDTTRRVAFPKETMVGPSNPDPRPLPEDSYAAPSESDCVRASDPPETFYMRIVTSRGFTTRQKLDAAWAYANWLEVRGLNESADEMYKWGVDIAKAVLPDPDQAIDSANMTVKTSEQQTGFAPEANRPTPNLLQATTLLATHRARTGETGSALSTLLSVYRAYRTAPVSPFPPVPSAGQAAAATDIDAAVSLVTKIFSKPRFPPPPPSGDDPLIRYSEGESCEESELMLYIGEILFATSAKRAEGLAWTREAVSTAEANLQASGRQGRQTLEGKQVQQCKQCLLTGMNNWEQMLLRLVNDSESSQAREGSRDAGFFEWRGWFGGSEGVKGKTLDVLQSGMLEAELEKVASLRERIAREGIAKEMRGMPAAGGGVWIG